jgi:hypothetical protein
MLGLGTFHPGSKKKDGKKKLEYNLLYHCLHLYLAPKVVLFIPKLWHKKLTLYVKKSIIHFSSNLFG